MRIPLYKLPLPVYKARPGFDVHNVGRNDLLTDLSLKIPIYNRLPEFWRREFEAPPPIINQNLEKGTKRPQTAGLWTVGPKGEPREVRPIPVRVDYTKEVKKGLWGGEGIVAGFRYSRTNKMSRRYWKNWRPALHKKSFYSELLERHIETTVTARTLRLIDEAYGFDHYILKTPVNELCSDLGNDLKREMLLRLCNKDSEMYKDDPETRDKIYQRYKKYEIPMERAEWVGLSVKEAMWKQWNKEKAEGVHDPVPLLKIYTEQLKEQLKEDSQQETEGPESEISKRVAVFEPPANRVP